MLAYTAVGNNYVEAPATSSFFTPSEQNQLTEVYFQEVPQFVEVFSPFLWLLPRGDVLVKPTRYQQFGLG